MIMKKLLWLDDIRSPYEKIWKDWIINSGVNLTEYTITWVKNYEEFVNFIKFKGLPDIIFFDHDLGEDIARDLVKKGVNKRYARMMKKESMSGYDAAKWLVNYCLDHKIPLPEWRIQSANPVGANNINKLFKNYLKHNQF